MSEKREMTQRMAKCALCGKMAESSPDLPFFESRDLGSRAERQCHKCGYYTQDIPLVKGKVCYRNTSTPIPSVCINKGEKCKYGPWDTDLYYCGCRGWD